MKLYALKYKDEYIDFSDNEFKLRTNYHYEREDVKNDLHIVEGKFEEISI